MKKILLIACFFVNASFVFAQKADSTAAKSAKTRNVDGTIMSSANDIATNIALSPQLSVLSNAINVSGLADNLKSGTITFFAPANKAFEKLAPGVLDTLLLPVHKTELVNLINNHMITGKFTSKDILKLIKAGNGQASLTTVAGGTLTAKLNENRNIVLTDETGGQSTITRLDIEQRNGVLFIVDGVLLPKAK